MRLIETENISLGCRTFFFQMNYALGQMYTRAEPTRRKWLRQATNP